MFEKDLGPLCDFLYQPTIEDWFKNLHNHMKVNVPFGTCPYPKGENEITNFLIKDDGLLPPYVPGNERWKVEVRFAREKILGGYDVIGLLRTQKSLMEG